MVLSSDDQYHKLLDRLLGLIFLGKTLIICHWENTLLPWFFFFFSVAVEAITIWASHSSISVWFPALLSTSFVTFGHLLHVCEPHFLRLLKRHHLYAIFKKCSPYKKTAVRLIMWWKWSVLLIQLTWLKTLNFRLLRVNSSMTSVVFSPSFPH